MENHLPGFLDFTRPGKGEVDDSLYPPFIRFWKRYNRSFMRLLQLNLVYAIFTLPLYIWIMSLINVISTQAGGGVISVLGPLALYFIMDWPVPVLAVLMGIAILILGPATAALSYAALNCAWDRPGLFWAGFWDAWKVNWKQALPIGILDTVAIFASLYYLIDAGSVFGSYAPVIRALWILLLLIYCMIRVYIYPILVTVELSFGALVKNSLILALIKPWRPLLVIAIAAVLCILCCVADIILIPCVVYSFTAFTAAFVTEPMISRYLLTKTPSV